MHSLSVSRAFTALLFAATTALSAPAWSQPSDSAGAETLFREGRELVTRGDFSGACAKFRESNRLDPAVGTVFNIADCEERLGHLAQAWTLFQEVVQKLPESDERHAIAARRAAALEPRLPRLTLRLAASAPAGTRVTRDGIELGSASFGSALPLDPGTHRLLVAADGREEKAFVVTLGERETRELEVMPGPARTQGPVAPPPVESSSGSGRKTLGYVLAGVGVAGLVTGIVAGVLVLGDQSTVDENCDADKRCNAEGLDAAEHGKTFGIVTTVGLVTGAVGLGAGTYLILSAAPSSDPEARAASARFVTSF
jgi:hypothetical protein